MLSSGDSAKKKVQWDVKPSSSTSVPVSKFPRHLEQSDTPRISAAPFSGSPEISAIPKAPSGSSKVTVSAERCIPDGASAFTPVPGGTTPSSLTIPAPVPDSVSSSSPRANKSPDVVSGYEARVAKYEIDTAALRAQLVEEVDKGAKMANELRESVPRSQHRAEIVALEVRLAAHDLTNGREMQVLKAAQASATSARVKALDADWTKRWDEREAQFRKQWDAREESVHKESAVSLERIQESLEVQYGATLTDLTRQLSNRPNISREDWARVKGSLLASRAATASAKDTLLRTKAIVRAATELAVTAAQRRAEPSALQSPPFVAHHAMASPGGSSSFNSRLPVLSTPSLLLFESEQHRLQQPLCGSSGPGGLEALADIDFDDLLAPQASSHAGAPPLPQPSPTSSVGSAQAWQLLRRLDGDSGGESPPGSIYVAEERRAQARHHASRAAAATALMHRSPFTSVPPPPPAASGAVSKRRGRTPSPPAGRSRTLSSGNPASALSGGGGGGRRLPWERVHVSGGSVYVSKELAEDEGDPISASAASTIRPALRQAAATDKQRMGSRAARSAAASAASPGFSPAEPLSPPSSGGGPQSSGQDTRRRTRSRALSAPKLSLSAAGAVAAAAASSSPGAVERVSESLIGDVSELYSSIESLCNALTARSVELASLQNAATRSQAECRHAASVATGLVKELVDAQEAQAAASSAIADLQSRLSDDSKRYAAIVEETATISTREVDEAQARASAAIAALDAFRAAAEKIAADLTAARAASAVVNDEIATLRSQLAAYELESEARASRLTAALNDAASAVVAASIEGAVAELKREAVRTKLSAPPLATALATTHLRPSSPRPTRPAPTRLAAGAPPPMDTFEFTLALARSAAAATLSGLHPDAPGPLSSPLSHSASGSNAQQARWLSPQAGTSSPALALTHGLGSPNFSIVAAAPTLQAPSSSTGMRRVYNNSA